MCEPVQQPATIEPLLLIYPTVIGVVYLVPAAQPAAVMCCAVPDPTCIFRGVQSVKGILLRLFGCPQSSIGVLKLTLPYVEGPKSNLTVQSVPYSSSISRNFEPVRS